MRERERETEEGEGLEGRGGEKRERERGVVRKTNSFSDTFSLPHISHQSELCYFEASKFFRPRSWDLSHDPCPSLAPIWILAPQVTHVVHNTVVIE